MALVFLRLGDRSRETDLLQPLPPSDLQFRYNNTPKPYFSAVTFLIKMEVFFQQACMETFKNCLDPFIATRGPHVVMPSLQPPPKGCLYYVCGYVCIHTHTHITQYTLPVRALPSPSLLSPGVRGKIPGTQALLLCPSSRTGRRGLAWVGAGPGRRMPGSPVPTSKS